MATVVLGLAGQALGGPLLGGLGALAGGYIDRALFGGTTKQEGPRLSDLKFQASTAGAVIPRVWGKHRTGTQVIWATAFKETKKTETSSGGKGGGGKPKTKTITYTYSVSFAVGLCQGPIAGLGRLWLDGKLARLADYDARVYLGSESHGADPKILAVEGAARTPAFRGTAYIVFEDLPLEKFGNRVPQVTAEVIRRPPSSTGSLETLMRAVTLIPGTTEFGYATTPVSLVAGFNEASSDNTHADGGSADIELALDRLQDEAPEVESVALVVAWHGTDLRCGVCEIRPKVESADRQTKPFSWQVGPVTRSTAQIVSQFGGSPAAGGAPSDRSVYEAIRELKARGFAVTLYPFILMDVPPGNSLPNPYGGTGQPAYPWRGRITCTPAAGVAGTVDKTAAAATQVASFFGACSTGHFGWSADARHVTYSGPAEWGLRRLILHLARIAQAAGGVDAFLIGSELVGLTTIRSAASTYPAVARLQTLAADVRAMLGSSTKIGYAADWSEYHSHRPADGSGDVYFHLDPLWAHTEIDFVGIDNYLPAADWRDGLAHLDALAGARSTYDPDYLAENVEGGEYFDWFYANQAARDAQTRTPIVDAAYSKPWVFRNKDIRAWWLNSHRNRPGGVESASATAWTPQSKPIWFTELGCPAVDKGANQPNVFVDPKSSESFYPYYSSGRRDDAVQRAFLEAVLGYWLPAAGNNPVSTLTGERMIAFDRIHLWTWDARPYPEFPQLAEVWADAANWRLGHWLSGRLGLAPLADVVGDIAGGLGIESEAIDTSGLRGVVWGYLVDRVQSARDTLNPLATGYFFDAAESDGAVRFRHRGGVEVATIARADLVRGEGSGGGDFALTRGQESELPRQLDLTYFAADADYRQAVASSRRLVGATGAVATVPLGLALPDGRAQAIADALLIQEHVERERATLALPPSALARDAGEVIVLDTGARTVRLRIAEIGAGLGRPVQALREEAAVYDLDDGPEIGRAVKRSKAPAPPVLHFLDLPLLRDEDSADAHAPRLAAYGRPWQAVAVYRAPTAAQTLRLDTTIADPATIGVLALALPRGPVWRWDHASVLTVEIGAGLSLDSVDELTLFDRANVAAVRTPSGRWEVLQWRDAELVAPRTFALSALLRGQLGTDADMSDLIPAGSPFVLLDDAVEPAGLPRALMRASQFWKWGPSRHPPTHALYESGTFGFAAVGIRPLSPVHLSARRDSGGDVTFAWIRRSRLGADDWEQSEIPLGEEAERYELDVMDGAAVKRRFAVTSPAAVYTAAQQLADWGAPPASLTIIVHQVSAAYGRGAGREAILDVV